MYNSLVTTTIITIVTQCLVIYQLVINNNARIKTTVLHLIKQIIVVADTLHMHQQVITVAMVAHVATVAKVLTELVAMVDLDHLFTAEWVVAMEAHHTAEWVVTVAHHMVGLMEAMVITAPMAGMDHPYTVVTDAPHMAELAVATDAPHTVHMVAMDALHTVHMVVTDAHHMVHMVGMVVHHMVDMDVVHQ